MKFIDMIRMKWSKPVLWLIIGRSGAGKDTVARMLAKFGWNVICSYTTRPMREGEKNMREHIFINESEYNKYLGASDLAKMALSKLNAMPTLDNIQNFIMAYTLFGGYHYFTLCRQVLDTTRNAYVIDEAGANELIKKYSSVFTIRTLNIVAFSNKIKERGVDENRMSRDKERVQLCVDYDYAILNNGTIQDLKLMVEEFITKSEIYENMEL